MSAVVVDRSTLYCLGESTDPAVVSGELGACGVQVVTAAPGQELTHRMVALAAHDLSAEELARICTATTGSWVHLVSSGYHYPHLGTLAERNLVTRSARAYAAALSEYVVTQHVRHSERKLAATEVPKPFNRRAALVVGFGAFGRTVAQTLAALGAEVTVVRPRSRTAHPLADPLATRPVAQLPGDWADLLVVALPGLAAVADFVGDDLLRCLRADGHLINPARADPVDFDALLRWLKAGAGRMTADVEIGERAERLRPWVDRGRVTLTPHIAWRPWDGDPLYHRDWLAVFGAAAGSGPVRSRLRMDPTVIPADYLMPHPGRSGRAG